MQILEINVKEGQSLQDAVYEALSNLSAQEEIQDKTESKTELPLQDKLQIIETLVSVISRTPQPSEVNSNAQLKLNELINSL